MSISSYSGFRLSDQIRSDVIKMYLGKVLSVYRQVQPQRSPSASAVRSAGSLLLDVVAQLLTDSGVTCTCLSDDEVKENDTGNHDCDKPNDPEHIVLFLGQGVGSVNSGEVSH